MTIEFKNFLHKLSVIGKRIIHHELDNEDSWDDLYILVSQLEIDCKKFRKEITIRREKNDKQEAAKKPH